MLWILISACAAFFLSVLLDIVYPLWTAQHPFLYPGIQGLCALLWLPVPSVTLVLLSTPPLSGYSLCVVWGTVGFLLQVISYWLRLSQERAIVSGLDQSVFNDRRYWELQHRYAVEITGRFWRDFTGFWTHLWTFGLALTIAHSASAAAASALLGVVLAVVSVGGAGLSVLRMGRQLPALSKSWPWLHRLSNASMVDRFLRTVALGLMTGWLLVTGLSAM